MANDMLLIVISLPRCLPPDDKLTFGDKVVLLHEQNCEYSNGDKETHPANSIWTYEKLYGGRKTHMVISNESGKKIVAKREDLALKV